jgi:hypothetical protein
MVNFGGKGGPRPTSTPKKTLFSLGRVKRKECAQGVRYSLINFNDIVASNSLSENDYYASDLHLSQRNSSMCLLVGIYFRVRVFYNIILALLLKLASSGSLLVQTIYIVSGIIAMLVTLST